MRFSIIVPAYNESRNIRRVLKTIVSYAANTHEVIVVDDGSHDDTSLIAREFGSTKVITLPKNHGKTYAVMTGVAAAHNEHILMMDADLHGLTVDHLKHLEEIYTRGAHDMLIMNYSSQEYILRKVIRSFPALSGVRAFRKSDFEKVAFEADDRFRLENKINRYFLRHNLRIGVMEADRVRTPHKYEKYSLLKGTFLEVPAFLDTLTSDQRNLFEVLNTWNDWQRIYRSTSMSAAINRKPTRSDLRISVVVPAYNEEKYIGTCLQALKRQTVAPDEIIVVDNNSSDRTAAIAREYGARVISEKTQGMSPARNAGFDAATGDIIARTDADTIAHHDWIERIHYHFARGTKAMTGSSYYDLPFMDQNHHIFEAYYRIQRALIGYWPLNGPNMILTKELWTHSKPHCDMDDKRVHEDIALSFAVHKFAKIEYHRDVIVHPSSRRMRENPQSFFIEYQARGIQQVFNHKLMEGKTKIAHSWSQQQTLTKEAMNQLIREIRNVKQFQHNTREAFEKILSMSPTKKISQVLEQLIEELDEPEAGKKP